MTILASTPDYLVEFEAGMLTIARRVDGHCVAMRGRGIAGDFRDCLKTHSPERVIQTYLRICPRPVWSPLYVPDRMKPHLSSPPTSKAI